MAKSLSEIEADIAALQGQASTLREQAKAQARPRLDEISKQVEALITEAVDIVDKNAVNDFAITLKPRRSNWGTRTVLEYSYGQFKGSGDDFDTSGWEAS